MAGQFKFELRNASANMSKDCCGVVITLHDVILDDSVMCAVSEAMMQADCPKHIIGATIDSLQRMLTADLISSRMV